MEWANMYMEIQVAKAQNANEVENFSALRSLA